MDINDIIIVLVKPQESSNIGAVCRAMANCGIHRLRIVGDKNNYDKDIVARLAIHANYIWDNAEFYYSIVEAVSDCVLSCGTTRRRGKKRGTLYLPRQFTEFVMQIQGKIAVVFGNERTGLTDSEIASCSMGLTIPTSPDFASLNLSHAVMIVCYELYQKLATSMHKATPVPTVNTAQVVSSVDSIVLALKACGFFSRVSDSNMREFWQKILSRSLITQSELDYITYIFNKINMLVSSKNNK